MLETAGHDGKGPDARCMQRARAPLAPGRRQLTMRVAVVDPQAYTPPYDDELCRALAAAGAEVELLTAHFTARRGARPRRLRAPRALRAAARRPDRAPPARRGCACRSRPAGTPSGSRGSSATCAPGGAGHRALAVGALACARPRALRAAGARCGRDRVHGARRAAAPLARRRAAVGRALRELRPRDRARRGQP